MPILEIAWSLRHATRQRRSERLLGGINGWERMFSPIINDMAIAISAYAKRRLDDEQVIWLTTVKLDGSPLPTPVWFIWSANEFVIFSEPAALKIKNIAKNARVALNFNGDPYGGNIVVFSGTAVIDTQGIGDAERQAYMTKYAKQIPEIGHTPESMEAKYSTVI